METATLYPGPNQSVYYPRVRMWDKPMERFMNAEIVRETTRLIDEQTGAMPTKVVDMKGTFEVKNNQRNAFSVSLSNYTYHYHAAHGMTYLSSLTFDLVEKRKCRLGDLFKEGSDYTQVLSAIVEEQIAERQVPLLGDFPGVSPNQDFYVADKCLVLYFQLYEITPYVYGFPMFPISVYDLMPIIPENGMLARLAENR
ncbi:DUF3298 and DUF4163 domain-containing protein [Salimicrobium halophilum]|uniref:DUF3298 and DUF4163 domain-containing protein n=1 Tax=Salimicrobium halophilum TaxID=86666 RepID=UPI002ADE1232|nr:DUF3298 domain-containing protein [Salimicrobium halophilum]